MEDFDQMSDNEEEGFYLNLLADRNSDFLHRSKDYPVEPLKLKSQDNERTFPVWVKKSQKIEPGNVIAFFANEDFIDPGCDIDNLSEILDEMQDEVFEVYQNREIAKRDLESKGLSIDDPCIKILDYQELIDNPVIRTQGFVD